MQEQIADFIARYEELVLPLEAALEQLRGDPQAPRGEIERIRDELRGFLRDRDSFTRIRVYSEADDIPDARIRRQAQLLYRVYLRHQREPGLREEIRLIREGIQELETEFRAPMAGPPITLDGLWAMLREGEDREERREAWVSLMRLAEDVAPRVLDLVSKRNRAARDLGFDDHHHLDLALRELEPGELEETCRRLHEATGSAFTEWKRILNQEIAARFHTRQHLLRPWHFPDPFRLLPPEFAPNPAPGHRRKDRAAAQRLLDGLGLELPEETIVDAVAPDEDEGAPPLDDPDGGFAELREVAGALRALAVPLFRKHLSGELPSLLRRPAQPFLVAAMGELFAHEVHDPALLTDALKLTPQHAGRARSQLLERARRESLLVARFAPVVIRFQAELYRHPGQDLAGLWWDLASEGLDLAPANRRDPAWALLPGILEGPGVIWEDLLARLAAAQMKETLDATRPEASEDGLLAIPDVGRFFRERLIEPGATHDWRALMAQLTGRPLDAEAFLRALEG